MLATIVIGTILFTYAGVMVIKSIRNVRKALQGEGCSSCDMSCQKNTIVKEIQLN